MKSLFKVLVALYIGVLGFGCFNQNNEEETKEVGEGEKVQVEETTESQAKTQAIKEEVAQGYNVAQEFSASVTIGAGEAAEEEELLVVIQSNKAGDESIVLVAEKSNSEASVRRWLGDIDSNISGIQESHCNNETMASSLSDSSASVAVVGASVEVLTGGIECSLDAEAECGSKVQGMMVKGLSKNEAGAISGVTLGKEGADDVVATLGSGKESDLNLALYKKFLSDINNESFCAELAAAKQAEAGATAEAEGAEAGEGTAEAGAEGDAAAGEGSAEAGAGEEGEGEGEQNATPAETPGEAS